MALAPITRVDPRPELVPLSFAQQRMWFINQFDTTETTYNIPAALRLTGTGSEANGPNVTGALDVEALRQAVADVIERHEVLRTVFPAVDGRPYQKVCKTAEFGERGICQVAGSEQELYDTLATGFDVTTQWPLRARLLQVADGEYIFAVVAHHIGVDGESILPLVVDIVTAYAARAQGNPPEWTPLPVQIADYAIWQHDVLGAVDDDASVIGRELTYWRRQLAGLPDVLNLPADRPRPQVASHRGAQVGFTIPAAVGSRIDTLAQANGVTPFMVVHAAFVAMLSKLSATQDIAIATPTAGRGQAVLDPLVGMFVNTLVLRTAVDPATSFESLLAGVRVTDLDAFAHAAVPFEAVVEALDPVRSEAFSPLAQVILSFNPAASVADADVSIAGLDIAPVLTPSVASQMDMTVAVSSAPTGDDWTGSVIYATDLFDEASILTMMERFVGLLDTVTADSSVAVGDVDVLLDSDRDALALLPEPVTATAHSDGTLVDAFAVTVAAHGQSPAVIAGEVSVSYNDLDLRSDAIASGLSERGVRPGDLVGVATDRSVDLAAAILGVLKAGAAYVPLDTTNPIGRLAFIVADSGTSVVVTDSSTDGHEVWDALPAGVRTLDVAEFGPAPDGYAAVRVPADARAYVIYTSGSTGQPKGVEVTHRDAVTLLDTTVADFDFGPGDVWTMFHSYAFDFSVWELWGALYHGGRCIIIDRDIARDTDAFVDLILAQGVTVLNQTPSAFYQLIDARTRSRSVDRHGSADWPLRYIVFGGEALNFEHVRRWFDLFPADRARLVNMYGITETTVHVSFRELDRDVVSAEDGSLIGRPLASLGIHILDQRLRPVPLGVVGEMYVSGGQLAQGYLRRTDLTSTRFVANPIGDGGSRLYRTGDLARRVGTDIEYIGRADAQVQLRGFRIEFGEVEAGLLSADGVVGAAARIIDGPSGDTLVGYVVPADGVYLDTDAVIEAAGRQVPGYMVPAVVMVVNGLPLTANGKLDRDALPLPEFGSGDDYVAPLGAIEEVLAAIVSGVLGLDRVSVTESFFVLGGDSIMSIQLASAARAAGFDLSPRQIFEHRTVRAMARVVADENARLPMLTEPAGAGSGEVVVPPIVSWMIEHSDQPSDFGDFNQSAVLAAPSGITAAEVAEILGVVIANHPMLSARLVRGDDTWTLTAGGDIDEQQVVAAVAANAAIGTTEYDDALVAAHEAATRRFDTATGRLVQAALVTDPAGDARIVLAIHHLGVDAVSWPVIIEDLMTAWAQRSAGHGYRLRDSVTSQRAWMLALGERIDEYREQLGYWSERLPQRPTPLGGDLDRDRDRVAASGRLEYVFDAAVTESLITAVPEAFSGNVNDAILAGLARAVRAWQRGRGIVDDAPVSVLLEGHGRYEEALEHGDDAARADLSRTVGWFTSISPMSLDPATDIVHAVKAAKEERLGQPDSGIGFGWLRYAADTELSGRPLPSIVFNYLGAGGGGAAAVEPLPFSGAAGPALAPSPAGGMVAQGILNITAGAGLVDGKRWLSATVLYPHAVLTESDVRDLLDHWAGELAAVAQLVTAGVDVGMSPSDVPGVDLTQDDIDHLARAYPGARLWPLSPLQGGLFFQSALAGGMADVDVYVAQAVLRLNGADGARLRTAAEKLVAQHSVLRSGFVPTGSGSVVAVVAEHVDLPWTDVDLTGVDDESAKARIDQLVAEQRVAPFDLSAPPLLRFVLVRHGDSATLIVTNHHIILDGWSGPLVLADMLALYATGSTYTEQVSGGATGDFGDYLRTIAGRDDDAAFAAWRQVLAPVEGPTLVAAGQQATADAMPRDLETLLDADLIADLEAAARAEGATLATALQVAWAIFLSRKTGNQVVTFGETVSGRPADLPGVESMIGLFINTLPAVVDVDPDASIGQVLRKVQADKVTVLDHHHLSLPQIAKAVDAQIAFDTIAVHESFPVDAESLESADASATGGLAIAGVEVSDSTHYPLNMVTAPVADGVVMRLKYLPSVFTAEQVEGFAGAVMQILRTIAADPAVSTADVSLLTDADRAVLAQLPAPIIDTAHTGSSLVDLFTEAAAAHPDSVAVSCGSESFTYAQLAERTDAVATSLRERGVVVGDLVGVATARSVDVVTAIVGVLKAGAAYLPLDVTNPIGRLQHIVSDSGVSVVLTDTSTDGHPLWDALGADVVVADIGEVAQAAASSSTPVAVLPDSRAYVIYTSGSTGLPKGVEVTHRDVVTLLDATAGDFEFGADDVWTMFHSYAFDFSVWELWGALFYGGRCVIVDRDIARDVDAFVELVVAEGVTVLNQTPSAFYQLIDARRRNENPWAVRYFVFGGEALSFEQVRRWFDLFPGDPARLVNMYGITETTVHVSFRELDRAAVSADDGSLIGRPLSSLGIHVLDARLRPVPVDVLGEMYVAGGQLAQGYLGRPDLTGTRFVADPFGEPGSRLYRTGDVARRVAGGDIEYVGRADTQVQLRGFRIEFGEVEAGMLTADGVVGAAARIVGGPSGDTLVGYVVADTGADVDPVAVQESAGRVVPAYMVPTVVLVVDALPLTANGKLDRDALPEPDFGSVGDAFVAPVTPGEAALADVFAEVLGLDEVSVTASFFDMGGNSLSAMRLAARAADALGVAVSVRDVFAAPTIGLLAQSVAGNAAALAPVVPVHPRPQRIPLSFAQQRVWFINRFDPTAATYNIPAVLRLTGSLDVDALRQSVIDVLGRHEVLRTSFPSDDGVPFQQVGDIAEFDARGIWRVVDSDDALFASATAGFDVTTQWPLRVTLRDASPSGSAPQGAGEDGTTFLIPEADATKERGSRRVRRDEHHDATPAGEYLLAVVAHHIGVDGESMLPLVTDIVAAYTARTQGDTPSWTPLPVQFADFAIWQHEVLGSADDAESVIGRQLGYWKDKLTGLP
ncbi:MAG: amino acid adenylation domain-containing protein, partial [Gordonia sp.]|uniref:non-ribosomal peptide synthetase n=1 Tax=Gordonia sp. (in: high G+C Gram-positive bacteria) TaxID=84139 RepID=UPI001D69A4CC